MYKAGYKTNIRMEIPRWYKGWKFLKNGRDDRFVQYLR